MVGAIPHEAAGGGVGTRGRGDAEARVCEGVRAVARCCLHVASTTLPFQSVRFVAFHFELNWSECDWFGLVVNVLLLLLLLLID